jgi:hypothetical protein
MEASVNNYLPLLHLVTLCDSQGVVSWPLNIFARRKISVDIVVPLRYNKHMNTQTPLQDVVKANLSAREHSSLTALQKKVNAEPRGSTAVIRVSDAQMRALQAAYDTAKASGLPLAPKVLAAAKSLGLK